VSVTYTEEVAYKPATCESVELVATLTEAQRSRIQGLTGASEALAPTASGAAGATASQAAATTYARYLKTSWIDPIDITISSQKVGLRWTSTSWSNWAYTRDSFKGCIHGVCLDKTYIVSGSSGLTTLSNGWKFNAKVHFRNTSFALWVVAVLGPTGWAACGFPTSNQADFNHSDTVTGYKTGASAWNWDDTKSGACTNLVHHGDETGASYPF
jgi:hypothetical protein